MTILPWDAWWSHIRETFHKGFADAFHRRRDKFHQLVKNKIGSNKNTTPALQLFDDDDDNGFALASAMLVWQLLVRYYYVSYRRRKNRLRHINKEHLTRNHQQPQPQEVSWTAQPVYFFLLTIVPWSVRDDVGATHVSISCIHGAAPLDAVLFVGTATLTTLCLWWQTSPNDTGSDESSQPLDNANSTTKHRDESLYEFIRSAQEQKQKLRSVGNPEELRKQKLNEFRRQRSTPQGPLALSEDLLLLRRNGLLQVKDNNKKR
jgi:hypothetical protein